MKLILDFWLITFWMHIETWVDADVNLSFWSPSHLTFQFSLASDANVHVSQVTIKIFSQSNSQWIISVTCANINFYLPPQEVFHFFPPVLFVSLNHLKKNFFFQTHARAHTHREKREGNKERFFYLDSYNFLTVPSLTKFQYDTLYFSQNKYFSKLGQTFVYI